MSETHQLLVSASPGDAVTKYAFEVRSILREFGDSELFALHIHPSLFEEVTPLRKYRQRAGGARYLLFHSSIGDPPVHSFLLDRPEEIILMYHNITPAHYFEEFDPNFARLLDLGRSQLTTLRPRVPLAIADSGFNAEELRTLGYQEIQVSPPIVDFQRLLSVEPHQGTMNHFKEGVVGPLILFVGQLLPHKRPDLLVQALHVLSTYHEPDAFLTMIGRSRIPRYRGGLQTFINELNLDSSWLTDSVRDEELAAFYKSAKLFATASEHEGFCVPLLEAMAFEIPIVARRYGAIPETVGDAGILLDPGDGPEILAETMATVLQDMELRNHLTALGRERLKDFDPGLIGAGLREILAALF